ncbi:MAG: organoarsenical effux MFS transporter ArsJ [Ilumatobacteraceae bacterium]
MSATTTRDYTIVTAGYWAFTVTDGALRMLVLLHFHELGYSPVALAFLFLLYEVTGIATNLLGGWVGARRGLNRTLVAGLGLQVVALIGLSVHDASWARVASVAYVMGVQALSGIAKDLTKMSSKSTVKLVAGDGSLFRLVAVLTGSKNALKGVGFFVGAALLGSVGYDASLGLMAGVLAVVLGAAASLLQCYLGRATRPTPLRSVWTKSSSINRLAAARVFLFASRDSWFVVALPVFLTGQLGWAFEGTGGFLAAWVIGYGFVQALAPRLIGEDRVSGARRWSVVLVVLCGSIAVLVQLDLVVTIAVVGGLVLFGVVFAVNSSLHSYLILAYSRSDDDVATDVGFYYSANAVGRLLGTLLSGVLSLWAGLQGAMWGSAAFLAITWLLTLRLPRLEPGTAVA